MSASRNIAIFALFGAVCAAACSPGTNAPAQGNLTVSFPSTNAAIASDTLELHVFDGSDPNTCLNVVQARQSSQPLPMSLFDIPATSTCTFLKNQVKPVSTGYGARAFLVVAQRVPSGGGTAADFLIGCSLVGIGDVSNQVDVDLTVIDDKTTVPESTKCAALSAKCAGQSCY